MQLKRNSGPQATWLVRKGSVGPELSLSIQDLFHLCVCRKEQSQAGYCSPIISPKNTHSCRKSRCQCHLQVPLQTQERWNQNEYFSHISEDIPVLQKIKKNVQDLSRDDSIIEWIFKTVFCWLLDALNRFNIPPFLPKISYQAIGCLLLMFVLNMQPKDSFGHCVVADALNSYRILLG